MTTPIRWFYPLFDEKEKMNLLQVIESGYINDGEITRQFEEKVANFIGAKYCVAVTSGTVALTLSLMAHDIGPGDEVILPNFTFIATANAVRLAGANVKLVDIESKRFTIDPNRVKEAIGKHTKAVIPVDVNGRGADYEALESICKEHGLVLISDSAEALGSKYKGKFLGTFGHAGCFSFSANKTVSSGQGGMIATQDEKTYYRLRELKDQGRRFGGTGGDDLHPVLGFNFKYTNLQAAVALAQLEKLKDRLLHFGKRDHWYFEALKNCPEITLPPLSNEEGEVRQWTDLLSLKRSQIEAVLKANQIGFRPFWFPLNRQNPYRLPDKGFENSIEIAKNGLWLPSSFEITREEVEKVGSMISNEMLSPVGVS